MIWQAAVGALLGAALGYGVGRLAPRWMEGQLRPGALYGAAVVNGVLTGLLAWGHGLDRYFWTQMPFFALLMLASLVDLHDRIIPNEVVVAGLALGTLLIFLAPYADRSWKLALGGAALSFGLLLLLALLVPGGMGLGDVKLAAVIGLFLGLKWVGMGLIFAFVAGGLISGVLLLTRRVGRKAYIPFGPFLALGSVVAALYGPQIWAWYTGL